MDFSVLRDFVTVCEEKQISAAADKLFISKQALSNILRRLEDELAVPLLIRTHTGVRPTAQGELFLERAYRILSIWDSTVDELSSSQSASRRALSVGFEYACRSLWSARLEASYLLGDPHADLYVMVNVLHELLRQMDERRLDLIVCLEHAGPLPHKFLLLPLQDQSDKTLASARLCVLTSREKADDPDVRRFILLLRDSVRNDQRWNAPVQKTR